MSETRLHTIRLADPADIEGIRTFIRTLWNENHIFARSREFFGYEHVFGERVNFAVAIHNETGRIDGIVGFIKYTEGYEGSDIFGAMWKVRENCGDPFLGVSLLLFLKEDPRFRSFSGCGINPKTIPIYRYLGVRTDRLRQYYMVNDRCREFRIASIRRPVAPPVVPAASLGELRKIETAAKLCAVFSSQAYQDRRPYKDAWYLQRRYFQHPVYRYDIFGIGGTGTCRSILVAREIEAAGAKVLRIVDFIGCQADLPNAAGSLRELMHERGCEYIDFYEFGLTDDVLTRAGFVLRGDDDPNVIPNYFEPFVAKNIDIHFFTTAAEPFCLFKGDGDQDRPSITYLP